MSLACLISILLSVSCSPFHVPATGQVFFLPMTNTILTCFKDDSVHGWEADTLEYKFLLPSSSGPSTRYRAFAASSDGAYGREKKERDMMTVLAKVYFVPQVGFWLLGVGQMFFISGMWRSVS